MKLSTVGTKRLVGSREGHIASATRIELSEGKKQGHGWLLEEDSRPFGIEPSWDKALQRLRSMGYKVRSTAK